jgi:hypothetical protein
MASEISNTTEDFIDLSINKSIDFITAMFSQLMQLIVCLLIIILVGKIVSTFVSKPTPADNENSNDSPKAEPENTIEQNSIEPEEQKLSGWESEPIFGVPFTPPLEIPSSNVPAKIIKKQFKRKCLSVGPIMLTPTSQIVRTLNVEEREERYTYDIRPLEVPKDEGESAVNVCVPCFVRKQSHDLLMQSSVDENRHHMSRISIFIAKNDLLPSQTFRLFAVLNSGLII